MLRYYAKVVGFLLLIFIHHRDSSDSELCIKSILLKLKNIYFVISLITAI